MLDQRRREPGVLFHSSSRGSHAAKPAAERRLASHRARLQRIPALAIRNARLAVLNVVLCTVLVISPFTLGL